MSTKVLLRKSNNKANKVCLLKGWPHRSYRETDSILLAHSGLFFITIWFVPSYYVPKCQLQSSLSSILKLHLGKLLAGHPCKSGHYRKLLPGVETTFHFPTLATAYTCFWHNALCQRSHKKKKHQIKSKLCKCDIQMFSSSIQGTVEESTNAFTVSKFVPTMTRL